MVPAGLEVCTRPGTSPAPVRSASVFVTSDPQELTVAFPRYRVYFSNASDRTVGVYLYGYMTH